jgi:hypothetical protein
MVQDKAKGSQATPAAATKARSAGFFQVVGSGVKTEENSGLWRQDAQKSRVIKRLNRCQAPEIRQNEQKWRDAAYFYRQRKWRRFDRRDGTKK